MPLNKSIGSFAIKERGSANGHNGIRSVFNHNSTNKIARLHIGIDSLYKCNVAEYVLTDFTKEQHVIIDGII